MPAFNIIDNSNLRYRIGDTDDGLNSLPIYDLFEMRRAVIASSSYQFTVNSHSTIDLSLPINPISYDNGTYYPRSIAGFDFSLAYYVTVQKMYLELAESTTTLYVRFANNGSNNYTITRAEVDILYALRTNGFIQNIF